MELLQLQYFCDAAITENFSKTAKKYTVPASNISQSVKRLESELGTSLFARSANKIQLNETGKAFYQSVRAALDILADARQTAQATQKSKTIRVNTHICRRVVMNTIARFQRLHPDVSFVTSHTPAGVITDYDILVTDKDMDTHYIKTAGANDDLLLAYNPAYYSFPEPVTVGDLRDSPFVTMQSGNSMYTYIHKICNRFGFDPHIALQSEDPYYIRKCIESGLGISIVSELSWRGQFSEQVVLAKLGSYRRTAFVYQRPGADPLLQEFYRMLVEDFKTQDRHNDA